MDTDYERIRRAIIYIEDNALAQPTLQEVAAHMGLSPAHLQRIFKRWAGVSPKRFLQALTVARAKELLRESRPVIDAAFEVGLSGAGRLHDLMIATEAVTPGQYRTLGDGLEIRYGVHETPFGRCLIGVTDRGICALRFLDPEAEDAAVAELATEWPGASLIQDAASTKPWVDRAFAAARVGAAEAASPGRRSEPLRLVLKGTNFQIRVWEGLLRVPDGAIISYGDLAERLGVPSSTRAVASAVGANPIAYLIPCHRVLRSSGALGGYRWGTDRKTVLLERELWRRQDASNRSPQ